MTDQQQQKADMEAEQQQLLEILNRVGTGMTNNEDKLALASALRMSEFFDQRKEIDDEHTTHATNERAEV